MLTYAKTSWVGKMIDREGKFNPPVAGGSPAANSSIQGPIITYLMQKRSKHPAAIVFIAALH
jgi:hypothetical protein